MKYLALIIATGFIGLSFNATAQVDKAYKNLENYVDSVENRMDKKATADWDKVEARYDDLKSKVDKKSDKFTDEISDNYDKLEDRFEKREKTCKEGEWEF